MNWKALFIVDNLGRLIRYGMGAWAFGVWMNSFHAGIFMFWVLATIEGRE